MLRTGSLFSLFRRGPASSSTSSGTAAGPLLIQLALVSLVVISALGAFLTCRFSQEISNSAIRETAADTRDTLVPLVAHQLSEEDLEAPMTGERYAEFHRFLERGVLTEHTLRLRIWSPDGTILYSSDFSEVGTSRPVEDELVEALAGETPAHLGTEDSPELTREGDVLEVYAPLVLPGSDEVLGVLEIYESATYITQHVASVRKYTLGGLVIGVGAYAVIVFLLVHRSVRIIREQERRNIDARARDTVRAVVAALDLRDTETEHHATRVAEISAAIARRMGLPPEKMAELEIGALLHDVGKIGISDRVLRKPGPLTDEEWAVMRRHPELGYQLLQKFPNLRASALLVRAHHERVDGTGYPHGLRGKEIPLPARIFAVADAYDAITSERPYRAARSHEAAVAEIRRCAGSQFDPNVVRAFLAIADRFSQPASHDGHRDATEKPTEDTVPPRAA